MGGRVTIQDIADELGLSRNTVSKALNDSEGIAEATRKRIIEKAIEMGYRQFAFTNLSKEYLASRGLQPSVAAAGDKTEIAFFSTAFISTQHFASLMLDAFQREISRLGYTLNAHRITPDDLENLILPMTFDKSRVAGIICVEVFDHPYAEMLCDLGIPTLFVDSPARMHGEVLRSDELLMDNCTQSARLINEMIDAGVTEIGFVGNWKHCQSFLERYAIFRSVMGLADLPVNKKWTIRENYADGMKAKIAKLDKLPKLFFCANDFVALELFQALRELGYDVPRDVAVAGFDDAAESRRCVPALTTIHIHTQIMAFTAVSLLCSRIKEPWLDFRRVYTQTDLIYRDSTSTLIPIDRQEE